MTERENDLRREIVEACSTMNTLGINQGTSGNISLRCGEGLLITPSGIAYDKLTPDLLAFMSMDGSWEGPCSPSSEWRFHLNILQHKKDVQAIVHCHPTFSTIMAIMGREIPAVHYMVAVAGGATIPCAPYATFGSPELSAHVLEALQDRSACLLAHHGLVATGPGLEKALWLAVEVEALARQYHGCLQLGEPPILPDEEMRRVVDKFRNYGLRGKK